MSEKKSQTPNVNLLKGITSGDLPTVYANMLAVVSTDTEVLLIPCDFVPEISNGEIGGELQTRPLGFIRMSTQTALGLIDSLKDGLKQKGIIKK